MSPLGFRDPMIGRREADNGFFSTWRPLENGREEGISYKTYLRYLVAGKLEKGSTEITKENKEVGENGNV